MSHLSVMVEEVLAALRLSPGDRVIDATVGGGGHAEAILEHIPKSRLLGIECDHDQYERARVRLKRFKSRAMLVCDSYTQSYDIALQYRFKSVQGFLLDLGFALDQIEESERGLSFLRSGPLDMRFDRRRTMLTAEEILNTWSIDALDRVFKEYGELPMSRALARRIVGERTRQPSKTTTDLVAIVEKTLPHRRTHHPATLAFQALRIAVNNEFEAIRAVLPQAIELLDVGGRLAVLTYHSGEDRIVKTFMHTMARDCVCPPQLPLCQCNHRAQAKMVKGIAERPRIEEQKRNPSSRSAHLRVVEKL